MYQKSIVDDGRFGHDDERWERTPVIPVDRKTAWWATQWLALLCRLQEAGPGQGSSRGLICSAEVLHGEGDSANGGSVSIIDPRWCVARRNLAELTLGQGPVGRHASHGHESWPALLPEAIRVLTVHHRSSPDLSTPLLNPTRICCGTIPRFRQNFRLIPVPQPPLQCLAAPTSNPS